MFKQYDAGERVDLLGDFDVPASTITETLFPFLYIICSTCSFPKSPDVAQQPLESHSTTCSFITLHVFWNTSQPTLVHHFPFSVSM